MTSPARSPASTATARWPRWPSLLDAVPLVAADEAVDVARRAAARPGAPWPTTTPPACSRPCCRWSRPGGAGALLLEVADARMRAGDVASAQARCLRATELGRSIDDGTLVVDAALAFEDANWRAALHGGAAEELLRAALPLAADPWPASACAPRSAGRWPCRARATRPRRSSPRRSRRPGRWASTRRSAWPTAALFVPWTPDNLDRLRRTAREAHRPGPGRGRRRVGLGAIDKLLFGTITAGYLDEARRLRARHGELTGRIGQPLFRVLDLQAQALMAMGEGRFVEAEAHAEEADALAGFLSGNDVAGGYGVQLFSIRRDQGRLDEARPLVEAVARLDRVGATWRPALTVLQAELGLHDEARAGLGVLVADGLAAVPRTRCGGRRSPTSPTPPSCSATGTRRWPSTASWCRRGLVVQAAYMLAAYGAADRTLGELCVLLGQPRRRGPLRGRAPPRAPRGCRCGWRTQLAYGRFLGERSGPVTASGRPPCCGPPGRPGWRSGWPGSRRDHALVDSSAPPGTAPGAGERPAGERAVGALTARELALLPLWPRAAPTGRSASGSTSASTRRPTTCGRSCSRPAAPTAPRPRPGRCGRVSPATDGGRPRLSGRRGWRRATARSPR